MKSLLVIGCRVHTQVDVEYLSAIEGLASSGKTLESEGVHAENDVDN